MSSREKILKAVRANQPDAQPIPDLKRIPAVQFDDLTSQFEIALGAVKGTLSTLDNRSEIPEAVQKKHRSAKSIISTVPEMANKNMKADDERSYHGLDLLVLQGEIAVAENGAIWVSGDQFKHQSVLFLAEHMVIVVSQKGLVNNMHEGYARLAKNKMPTYGVWIAGPSKTADIEQSLVIGAQGARSNHILLVP